MSVMQTKADAAQNLMNVGSKTSYGTTSEWLEAVRKVLSIDNGVVLAVNAKSTFYTSSGYYARWSTPEDLTDDDGIPMIRELTFHGSKDTYMIFMRVIDENAAFDEEGNSLTHVIVAIPLSDMEKEFTITGFGESIFTYMINSSGRRLYKQTYSSSFIEEFNVLTALEDYEFTEDGAKDLLEEAIRGRTNACTEFKVPETKTRFFVSTVPIEDTDWSVLVFVPTEVLGKSSNQIISSLRLFAIVIVFLIAGILALLLSLNFHRISTKQMLLQQEETNRMLDAAAQEADRTNQAKTSFLMQVSHDIRTPINAIVGMVATAGKNISDSGQLNECLNNISGASNHLISMINDLLEMSRIETGRIDISHRPFNIKTIVDNSCYIVDSERQTHNIEFQKEFDKITHPTLVGDELRLRQIFINILGNAIKFTRDGGHIIFRVKELESTENTDVLRFEIEDNGIGMSEEFVEHLFEPFSQEFADSCADYPGAGLGMAITKKYVELMGGKISVSSRPSDGTCIRVEISFEVFDIEGEIHSDSELHNLKGMRVLLVEDDEENRSIAQKIMEEAGIRVINAADGKSAVDIFEDSAWDSFDAILTEVLLPNMNGYEAAQAIRTGAHPKGAIIPIIAMTANASVEDVSAALSSGMNAYVPKPMDSRYLFGVLSQYYHVG
jgi:signal transduction histidine kinase/CheY-like chemotaxis protein